VRYAATRSHSISTLAGMTRDVILDNYSKETAWKHVVRAMSDLGRPLGDRVRPERVMIFTSLEGTISVEGVPSAFSASFDGCGMQWRVSITGESPRAVRALALAISQ
jgi:hypothetical protein